VSNDVVVLHTSTFEIVSALVQVEGTKIARPNGAGGVVCGAGEPQDFPMLEFAGGQFVALYDATITSPLASFDDHAPRG
jgi:hypothetical protein